MYKKLKKLKVMIKKLFVFKNFNLTMAPVAPSLIYIYVYVYVYAYVYVYVYVYVCYIHSYI